MKLPIAKLLPAAPNRNSHTHQLVMVYAKHGHGSRQASTGQRGPILQDSTYRKSQVTNALPSKWDADGLGCVWQRQWLTQLVTLGQSMTFLLFRLQR